MDFSNYEEAVSYLYGYEENLCLMRNYGVYRQALSNLIPEIEEMLQSIKENMRISEEDLHDLIYKDEDEEDESISTDSKSNN